MNVMRRTSLTNKQAQELAAILRARRQTMNLSVRQLAAVAGVHLGTISGLEHATNLTPQPEILKAIAKALSLSMSDLFIVADWLPAGELPSLQPYLRAKYGLGKRDAAELDDYLAQLQAKHGSTSTPGPRDHEDEH